MRKKEPLMFSISGASKCLESPLWLFELSGSCVGFQVGSIFRVKFAKNGRVPSTSHKLKLSMKTASKSSRVRSCLKWRIDVLKVSTDICPELRTIRRSIGEERLAKNGLTIVFSKPLIFLSEIESRRGDRNRKIWDFELSSSS